MSKRHVAYIRPEDPSFLKKIKQQAGYKEGPTVDTKRENLGDIPDEDLRDTEDEHPTVVVLNPGDLTAEEAAQELQRIEKDEAPADLSNRIIFKAPNKSKSEEKSEEKSSKRKQKTQDKKSKKLKNKHQLLSFQDEEEDD